MSWRVCALCVCSLQRVLAAFFVVRQAEEEKTAEQVGTAASLTDGSMPGSTTASVGPVRSAEELEQRYMFVS